MKESLFNIRCRICKEMKDPKEFGQGAHMCYKCRYKKWRERKTDDEVPGDR